MALNTYRKEIFMQNFMKKAGAIFLILSLLLIIGLTFYFGITGSDAFLGMVALMIFYPVFLWAMSYVLKWGRDKNKKESH